MAIMFPARIYNTIQIHLGKTSRRHCATPLELASLAFESLRERGRLVASLQSAVIFLKFVHPCLLLYLPSYLSLFLWFRHFFFYFRPLNDSDSFTVFFFRTRISQFITGSTYTVFTFGVVLWVKWKATESLILLFIPWYRPSSVQLSKLTHVSAELFKEAEHSFSWNSLSLYCVC